MGRDIKKVSAGLTHSGCITDDGKVFLWGLNGDPKLSPELKSKILMKVPTEILFTRAKIDDLQLGNGFTIALTSKGEVYAWGKNDKG